LSESINDRNSCHTAHRSLKCRYAIDAAISLNIKLNNLQIWLTQRIESVRKQPVGHRYKLTQWAHQVQVHRPKMNSHVFCSSLKIAHVVRHAFIYHDAMPFATWLTCPKCISSRRPFVNAPGKV